MSEERLLFIRLQMEELICEREAMIVLNQIRERQGYAPGYNEKDFYTLKTAFENVRLEMSK